MSQGPSEDPGGPGPGAPEHSNQELSDLKDQFKQQQTLIAQLKEMLRKGDQTSVTQEKVAEYANTLSKMNARAKRSQKETGKDSTKKSIETPASEKILLLRQQMEQNKAKLAERGKSQKGVEERVLQIRAQLDDSQHMMSQTPLNISLIDDRVDYSPNDTSQELYNILLTKDKRITELNAKMSKLEANVLDLQENLKEKDSVIDARTKAITLMSENLSKKSKTTLDTLDDTKEQMRKMQTNFIQLEEDMKEENCRLKQLLEGKDLEICQLQSENDSLLSSNRELTKELEDSKSSESDSKLKERIVELEEMIKKLQAAESSRISPTRTSKRSKRGRSKGGNIVVEDNSEHIKALESTIKELEQSVKDCELTIENLKKEKEAVTEESENSLKQLKDSAETMEADVNTLRKQLDESNKSMIKVKAQHKSKVKELNKKIDDFKKVSDVNAELVKLEAENSKLTQKVAVLEEEKGQMQLHMVESNDLDDFEAKIKEHLDTISMKNDSISSLEKVIQENKEQINSLTSKIESLSSVHSDKIQSDLTSVQFEEQLEKMEKEQQQLLEEKAMVVQENKELKSKIDELCKEKQEINSKLDNYIQENMELMDRLDKLSVEKVSSAESIEIVENLTQQEKLELEAYQKNIISKNMDILEDNPELNQSINQLTEETSELLQRIELFTVERKEVMEKMEQLTQENNQLTFRIKEVENNRDVLVETYEQLQTEKEELDTKMEDRSEEIEKYKTLIEDQRREIEELNGKLLDNQSVGDETVRVELDALKSQYTALLKENDTLKNESEKFNEDKLNQRIAEFEGKLNENLEEIENYKAILETNKDELIHSANMMNDLQGKLKEKSSEIEHYQSEVTHLNGVIDDLNEAVEKLEEENRESANKGNDVMIMELQLAELKSALKENLEQTQEYDQELQENSATIKSLNEKLKQLNNEILETEHLLASKDDEIKLVKREQDQVVEDYETKLRDQAATFNKTNEEMKVKYIQLQKQIDQNSGSLQPLESKVQELEKKNKDQLEKMKKIAANLKKKTLDYKALETKCSEIEEKWESEKKEKEERIKDNEAVKAKVVELEEQNELLKSTNIGLMAEIGSYTAQVEDLQNVVREYETQLNAFRNEIEAMKLNSNNCLNAELNSKDETIAGLKERLETLTYESETNSNALQMKIKELELFIESQNEDMTNYKERVNKLEEALSIVEERRLSLEGKAIQLGIQLEEKESCAMEASIKEANIGERLNDLIEKDKLFNDRLNDTLEENQELQLSKQQLLEENESLKKSLNELGLQLKNTNQEMEDSNKVSEENISLKNSVGHLENEVQKLLANLQNMKSESEKNESELQEQLQEFNLERKQLLEQCEVLNDQKQSFDLLQEESSAKIRELNEKLDQQQTTFDEITAKFDVLEREYQITLNNLEESQSKMLVIEEDKNKQLEELSDVKTQLDFAKNMIKHVEENSLKVMSRNDELEKRVEEFSNQKPVSAEAAVNKIEWPELSQNPFDFVGAQQPEMQPNSQQEKIRTLEFMLYTAEKEKESALMECNQLSGELAKILYERERKGFVELESQIQEGGEVAITPEVKSNLEVIQFQETHPPQVESLTPIVEEACVAKTAYVCHPEKQSVNAFGENDDGWGWGAEEAKLEQEHIEQLESDPSHYVHKIKELEANVMVLEAERESTLEELKQAQVKSGKLIKKLKEFKVKNDQLTAKLKSNSSNDGGFKDLEDAMMDELKSQVETLEKKLKEILAELEKEKLEKANVLKRVDVLTSANERMVEMKEKQDIEVMAWQRRNRELSEKLEQFEWGTDSFESHNKPSSTTDNTDSPANDSKIRELNDIIKELSIDNEELQSLLEEQRTMVKEAARAKSMEPISENMKTEAEYNALLQKNNELLNELTASQGKMQEVSQQLQVNYVERTQLEAAVMECNITIEELNAKLKEFAECASDNSVDELKLKIDSLENEKMELAEKNRELSFETGMLSGVRNQLDAVEKEKMELFEKLNDARLNLEKELLEKQNLLKQLEMVEAEKAAVFEQLEESRKLQENGFDSLSKEFLDKENHLLEEIANLNGTIQRAQEAQNELLAKLGGKDEECAKLLKQNEEMEGQLRALQNEKNNLALEVEELKKMEGLKEEQSGLLQELQVRNGNIIELQTKLDDLDRQHQAKLEQLQAEWTQLVDERGNQVAECWKIHVDTREKEFSQMEQKLRNDLDAWEGKYNAMITENNELKRNVDDEIRGEIERMTALQKDVLEKQHQINDLTRVLQEKQAEIDNVHVQNDKYTAIIQQLNSNIEESGKKAKDIEELYEEREAKIRVLNERIVDLADKIKESDELRKTLQSREDDITRKEAIIKELNTQVTSSSESENALKTLQLELHERQNELKENETYLEEYKRQLEQHNVKIQALETNLAEKENALLTSQNTVQQHVLRQEELQQNELYLVDYKSQLEQCTLKIQTLEANLAVKENELLTSQSVVQQQLLQQEELRQNESYLQDYKVQLEQWQLQAQTVEARLMESEQELAARRAEDVNVQMMRTQFEELLGEVNRLSELLKEKDASCESISNLRLQEVAELTAKLDASRGREDTLVATESELSAYKQQLEEQQTVIANLQLSLQQGQEALQERTDKIESAEKEYVDMQEIIESQQLAIEELKREVFDKSTNYDALIAEMNDVQDLHAPRRDQQVAAEENAADPVNRAELDLALYMLHQRDVRCEELTVELMQLLEERDTLQLRLSNAIREKEELRSKKPEAAEVVDHPAGASVSREGAIPKSRAIVLGATGTEMATEAVENLEGGALANKLSELKSVGYRKDKTIVDEQELRRIQQLSILQQHKDDVSKLPAEAAARLVDASYTLSRDVQSPSKVLLNWLWGKSTPKVNNI